MFFYLTNWLEEVLSETPIRIHQNRSRFACVERLGYDKRSSTVRLPFIAMDF